MSTLGEAISEKNRHSKNHRCPYMTEKRERGGSCIDTDREGKQTLRDYTRFEGARNEAYSCYQV